MSIRQKPSIKQSLAAVIGCAMTAGLAATVSANPIPCTVTDVTDWNTTPMEVVNTDLTYLGYNGGVYAGINTLAVTVNGVTSIQSGFCIDAFHWSLSGPVTGYTEVPLADAPKDPATMNAYTATEIDKLW